MKSKSKTKRKFDERRYQTLLADKTKEIRKKYQPARERHRLAMETGNVPSLLSISPREHS